MKFMAFVLAAAVASAAFAEEPAGKPAAGRGDRKTAIRPGAMRGERMGGGFGFADPFMRLAVNPQLAEKLGLSEEQKAKLKEIAAGRGADRDVQKRIRRAMEKQAELLKSPTVTEAEAFAVVEELFEARKAAAKEQVKRMLAARAVLTPEQIAKALEIVRGGGARPMRPGRAKQGEAPKPE